MAYGILFGDGFDHYPTGGGVVGKWNTAFNTISAAYSLNSFGKGARVFGETGKYFATAYDEVCLQWRSNPTGGSWILARFRANGGTVDQLRLELTADYALRAMLGSTELGRSAPFRVRPNLKHYFESHIKFDNAAGIVQVRADGELILNLSGVDTQNSAFNDCDGFHIVGADGGGDGQYIDDVLFRDWSVGSAFIGDRLVKGEPPDGDGDYAAWTPSAGSGFQCVDEVGANGDTDFIEETVVGDKHAFTITSHGITVGDVAAVINNFVAKKSDGVTREIRGGMRHSTTDVPGATRLMTANYLNYADILEDVPGGTGWTLTQAEDFQPYVEVVT